MLHISMEKGQKLFPKDAFKKKKKKKKEGEEILVSSLKVDTGM